MGSTAISIDDTSVDVTATISDCGRYRYTLHRKIPSILRWVRPVLFIMLNPSTADASQDDPTIRRCLYFAQRQSCTELTVVNLFALRATDPSELARQPEPVGPENDRHIAEQIYRHHYGFIVCAWGANPIAKERAEAVRKLSDGLDVCALGKTKSGAPRHPLYVRADAELLPFP